MIMALILKKKRNPMPLLFMDGGLVECVYEDTETHDLVIKYEVEPLTFKEGAKEFLSKNA